jgi:hypothetical protein
LLGLAGQREEASGVSQEELAGRRRGGGPSEPVEELDPELLFQHAHVLGDRGLGEEERLGRP